MNRPSRKTIAQETFLEILEKTIRKIPDEVDEIYMHFKRMFVSHGMNLDEQVLFLSNCIFESRGFQSKEEEDPTRNPGESEHEYLERLKYKGRGYLRLVGKDVYRASFGDLNFGNILKNPDIVSNSIKNSVAFSFWLWSVFVPRELEQLAMAKPITKMRGSIKAFNRDLTTDQFDKMKVSIKALNRDLTTDQFDLRLNWYEIAQEVVKEEELREDMVRAKNQIQLPRVETSSIFAPKISKQPTASLRRRKAD